MVAVRQDNQKSQIENGGRAPGHWRGEGVKGNQQPPNLRLIMTGTRSGEPLACEIKKRTQKAQDITAFLGHLHPSPGFWRLERSTWSQAGTSSASKRSHKQRKHEPAQAMTLPKHVTRPFSKVAPTPRIVNPLQWAHRRADGPAPAVSPTKN
jgi:hypothetical protein